MFNVLVAVAGRILTQDARQDRNTERVLALLRSEALSCKKCSGFAYPVYGSENKYCCLKCNSRFPNTRHCIESVMNSKHGLKTSAAYERAMLVLKSEL